MARPPAKVDPDDADLENETLAETLTPLFRPEKVEEGRLLVSTIISKVHEGPLPPPELLGGYEEVLPGAAERIVAMAEREQAHRHEQEARMIRSEYRTRWLGQCGAISAIVVLAMLVGYCVWQKQPIAAGVISAIGVIPIAFLRHTQRPAEKAETEKPKAPAKRQKNAKQRR